jgi:hypothetical protein
MIAVLEKEEEEHSLLKADQHLQQEYFMAAYTGEGIGRFTPSGGIKWRGSIFYSTSSTEKLAFLNNVIGVFEAEMDAEGNFSEKIWEWK